MSGICSKHQHHEEGCVLCGTHPREMRRNDGSLIFPDWDAKVAEAEAAGEVTCECGFTYYRTTDTCPMCGLARSVTGEMTESEYDRRMYGERD